MKTFPTLCKIRQIRNVPKLHRYFVTATNYRHLESNSKRNYSEIENSVPSSVDVVVIGGGVAGCSALYNLAKLGVSNTVLLESHQLTAGTTWHTAGMLFPLQPSDIFIQLVAKTREILANIEKETGINPGHIKNGGLFVIDNEVRMDEMKRLISIGKAHNVHAYLLDPKETKKLYPLMNVDDIHGSVYLPDDGAIDPSGYCNGLQKYAADRGSQIIEHCPVLDIKTKSSFLGNKIVSEVITPYGSIKTNCILNAAGAWSNNILGKLGIHLPYQTFKHSYVVTERIPGIQNMPNVREPSCSGYFKLQGDALAIGMFESNPVFVRQLKNNNPFPLFDIEWETLDVVLEGASRRIPILEKTGLKSTICGPESFTTDGMPILGEDPNIRGLYHSCNYSSSGMVYSGGCGHQIATWIINGRPDIDMFSYDIRRFNPSIMKDKKYIEEKAHEVLAIRYAIKYPHDESLAARELIKSPLHQILKDSGCVFQQRYAMERPGWFSDVPCPIQKYDFYGAYNTARNENTSYTDALQLDYGFDFPKHQEVLGQECLAARNAVSLLDMSSFGKLYLTGPDAQKAADWLFSANVQAPVGKTVYTCLLNQKGKVEADLTVSCIKGDDLLSCEPPSEGKGFYLTTGTSVTNHVFCHIMEQIVEKQWDVKLQDASRDVGILSLQGPLSRDILQKLTDENLSNASFPYMSNKIVTVSGHLARALRVSFVGELGWELHVSNDSLIPIYNALHDVGADYQLKNIGFRALDILSAEKGYLHWHEDMRLDDSPLEVGLKYVCKLKSSVNFLGRESLQIQLKNGLKRKLVTFTVLDPSIPLWGQEPLYKDDVLVGFVRRAEFGLVLQKTIGYGFINDPSGLTISKEFLSNGNWTVESMLKRHPIEVHLKHPFDAQGLRLKR